MIPNNDVVLDSPVVSRYHAQIERVGQRYRVRDLRSSNGTFVNDERIEGDVWLHADDAIRIGSYPLRRWARINWPSMTKALTCA